MLKKTSLYVNAFLSSFQHVVGDGVQFLSCYAINALTGVIFQFFDGKRIIGEHLSFQITHT